MAARVVNVYDEFIWTFVMGMLLMFRLRKPSHQVEYIKTDYLYDGAARYCQIFSLLFILFQTSLRTTLYQ